MVAAVVVFEVVNAPVGKLFGVQLLAAEARGVALTGLGAGRRVKPEFEPAVVDVVGEGGHPVGKIG
ncbi:MAG: hypothetical protein J07HN4v3_02549 [Halonotius sp. J07HN4]|nr:MAG: hypothetical protein J07HN4v3_02549 [Halonotius sp. J07HN4]